MRALTTTILWLLSNMVFAQPLSLVKDIRVGSSSSSPTSFIQASENKTFFFATDPATSSTGLYVTDGTSAGTVLLVANVFIGSTAFDDPFNSDSYLVTNGRLIFWANANNSTRYQVWHSDGTVGGTYALTTFSSGSPSIRSLVMHNNELYFFATGTSPAGIYKSSLISGDAQRIISHPDFDDISSRLYAHNGKLYRVVRNELFEVNGTQEILKYTLDPSPYCFSYPFFAGGKFVYNKVSCSTVDPIYQAMENYDLNTGTVQTLSTDPSYAYNKAGASIAPNAGGYYYFLNLVPAKVSGAGSKTSYCRIYRSNGQSIEFVSFHKYDSNLVTFNGFRAMENKLYFSLRFDPGNISGQALQYLNEIYELGGAGSTKLFSMTDKSSGYTFKKNAYVFTNGKLYFIADSVSGAAKSNLKFALNSSQFQTVYSSNSTSLSFDANHIGSLSVGKVLLSARDDIFPNDVGYELYQYDQTLTGLNGRRSQAPIVFPNPASDYIKILIEGYEKATLYDLQGRQLMSSEETELSLSSLKPGLYLLRVQSAGKEIIEKIIIR